MSSGESTVHIVDDDPAVRDSLSVLLQAAGFAVRSYSSGEEFLADAKHAAPGCVLLDVRMAGLDGLQVQERLSAERERLPVIIMTGHGDVPLAVRAMRGGASDFIEKPFEASYLIGSIRAALSGEHRPRDVDPVLAGRVESLTPREREVLEALVAGHSNKLIANALGISPRTVEIHRARVMEKMNASGLSELVRMALAAGISP